METFKRIQIKFFSDIKKSLQTEFRKKFGILLDMPKSGGSETKNDENTARRPFKSHILFSQITGIDYELINRLRLILLLFKFKL